MRVSNHTMLRTNRKDLKLRLFHSTGSLFCEVIYNRIKCCSSAFAVFVATHLARTLIPPVPPLRGRSASDALR